MIIRIVKMSFEPAEIDNFMQLFEENKQKIGSFEGCSFLELYRDIKAENIFFTYSHWETEDALNNYRHSELFTGVWSRTKILFNEKPEAWSVGKL